MANGHARLSPSGADRWMLCAGSAAMEDGLPDTSSSYADEGTAAHFLASEALATGESAAFYIGLCIVVEDTGARFLAPDGVYVTGSNIVTVNDEMARHVQTYIDHVLSFGGELAVECRLPIEHLTGEVDACGTSDAVIILDDELLVIDLKYGMGNRVDADYNRQLMIYALAAYEEHSLTRDFARVQLVIVQPRLNHVSEFSYVIEDLLVFGEGVKTAAKKATMLVPAFRETVHENLTPGEQQCKWCKAKATCPALADFVQETIGADFEDLTVRGQAVEGYAPADLGLKLKAVDLIETWCKAIRGAVEGSLLSGVPVPGWKLVQGKRGNRAWRNAEEAEEALKKMRVPHDKMYDYKVISPTTAEKLAKAEVIGPRQWPKVQALITQNDGKPSVAPESDKRPALVVESPVDGFEDVSDDDLI